MVSVDPPEAEKGRVAMQLTRKTHSDPNGIKLGTNACYINMLRVSQHLVR